MSSSWPSSVRVAVLAWLMVFETVNKLLWENAFVIANPWMFPVICLPFSLLVGLLVKYRARADEPRRSMLDSLGGDVSKIDWRRLPIAIVMPLVSLLSGAVLGPEGGIGGIASKIAAMYSERVGIPAGAPRPARLLDPGVGLQRADRQPAVHGRPGQ